MKAITRLFIVAVLIVVSTMPAFAHAGYHNKGKSGYYAVCSVQNCTNPNCAYLGFANQRCTYPNCTKTDRHDHGGIFYSVQQQHDSVSYHRGGKRGHH